MHSFHIDVCQNPELRKSLAGLTQAAQGVLVSLHQYCEGWKRHQSLWKSDKAAALDKFQVLHPSIFTHLWHAGGQEHLLKYGIFQGGPNTIIVHSCSR